MKKKTKKNLWVFMYGIFIGAALFEIALSIFGIAPIQLEEEISDLEQELQSCQEKVPVWILNVHCLYFEESIDANFTMKFDSYEKYQRTLNTVLEEENCEVIK